MRRNYVLNESINCNIAEKKVAHLWHSVLLHVYKASEAFLKTLEISHSTNEMLHFIALCLYSLCLDQK